MTRFLSLVRAIGLFMFVGIASSLCAQDFVTFDLPDSAATLPAAINLKGQIVGSYITATPAEHFGNGTHGFLRERDGTTTIIDASAVWGAPYARTFATAINLSGRITGYAFDPECGDCAVGFLRETDGTLTILRDLSNGPSANLFSFTVPNYIRGTNALDINAWGQIVGIHVLVPSSLGFLRQRDGTFIDFDVPSATDPPITFSQTLPQAINDLGQITGYANAHSSTYHGFLRKPNGTIVTFDPSDSTGTFPQGINVFGEITGSYTKAVGGSHGFLRRIDGKIIVFDPPGSVATQANAINLEGQIVGSYLGSDGIFHSFMRYRNGRFITFDAPGSGVSGTYARDINALGQITGYYVDPTGTHGFVMRLHGIFNHKVDE